MMDITKLKVGMKVRALRDDVDITKGNEYVIVEVDSADTEMPIRVRDDAGSHWWMFSDSFEPVAERQVNVGDRVRYVGRDKEYHQEKHISKTGVVTGFSVDFPDIKFDDGTKQDGCLIDNVEVIEEAPIAERAGFKVGDRVRTTGGFTFDPGIGTVSGFAGSTLIVVSVDGHGEGWNYFPNELSPLCDALTIQAGKFYKTRDGRRVGPARRGSDYYGPDSWYVGLTSYLNDGREYADRVSPSDLIAEWVDDEPANDNAATKTAIVCLIKNGQPKPSDEPFVHGDRASAEREASRLAGKHKGKEFGVYELVSSVKQEITYDHEWQRLAVSGQKIAAIRELRSLAGTTHYGTKQAVESWLAFQDAA